MFQTIHLLRYLKIREKSFKKCNLIIFNLMVYVFENELPKLPSCFFLKDKNTFSSLKMKAELFHEEADSVGGRLSMWCPCPSSGQSKAKAKAWRPIRQQWKVFRATKKDPHVTYLPATQDTAVLKASQIASEEHSQEKWAWRLWPSAPWLPGQPMRHQTTHLCSLQTSGLRTVSPGRLWGSSGTPR